MLVRSRKQEKAMEPKQLARLLSGRNEPSVLEKEALFERIVTAGEPRRRHRPTFAMMVAVFTSMAGAVAATALVLHFRTPADPELQSRGKATAVPTVRLACLETAQAGTCRLGDTLAFEIGGLPTDRRHFAAFARRADGVVIWYFPTADGQSEPVNSTSGLLKQAVRLGPPHVPGPYQIVVVFSRMPMTRADIKKALEASPTPADGILVLERAMLLREGT
jgi:hypothetical protein